nr:uncharacterized protein LOC112708985 [Arachis hypogaea]
MKFGQRWRNWVKEYVSTATMSVLVNGSPSKLFNMERGLRQGDPLSPPLFVLVVNVLHRMLGEGVRNGRIDPLLVGGEHITLSHLQFADDMILFCPPKTETVVNYKRLLRCFELMSGLSINFDKLNMISVNCEQDWVDHVCDLLGCKQAALPMRYLGIFLGANPQLVKTWKPIIDKVEEKLSLLKAKVLNKAGKLVLIKSVLNSLLIYYLSLYKMPKAVADKLIALQRRFMWCKGDGIEKGGGLGVGDAVLQNTALLFKWWWRFSAKDYPLWKKIVCSCNNLNPAVTLVNQKPPWRRELFQWELELVHQFHERLRPVQLLNGKEDKVLQSETLSDEITSYNFTSAIWRGVVPPRIEFFYWFMLVGRVNTKERLSRLGVISHNDNICVLCKKEVESVQHLFILCETTWQVQKVWLTGFFKVIWNIWMERNTRIFKGEEAGVETIRRRTIMSFTDWTGSDPFGC